MDKNYEKNPEKANYIKKQLYDKYREEIFEKYDIEEADLARMQVCTLGEFLVLQQDKYEKNRAIYETDENLKKIYAVVDKLENRAIMINTNQEGKLPEGEFGVYDFQKNRFEMAGKVKDEIVQYLGIGALPIEKQDALLQELFEQKLKLDELSIMDQLATMDLEKVMDSRISKEELEALKSEYIDRENEENGKTKEERNQIEKQVKDEEKEEDQKREQEVKQSNLPEHVVKYCLMAGIAVPKAVIDTKASEAADKIDEPRINRNGGNVTIIKTRDDSKQTDKYLVFQDGKYIIPGTRDEKIDKVVGKRMQTSKNGAMIKPLEIDDEEQYFEYSDSQGLTIREKIEENLKISIEDLENYKREMQKELEQYSQEMYRIQETPFLSDAQKDALYAEANERFNSNNEKIAKECNVELNDVKAINLATDERTQEQIEKENDDEEYDDRGKLLSPYQRPRE